MESEKTNTIPTALAGADLTKLMRGDVAKQVEAWMRVNNADGRRKLILEWHGVRQLLDFETGDEYAELQCRILKKGPPPFGKLRCVHRIYSTMKLIPAKRPSVIVAPNAPIPNLRAKP